MPAKRRPHWRKLEWVSGSRLNAPGITIHAHNRKSTIKNTRPSTVIILPNGNSMASSDGSGMDPFHRERDITSRIINNAPYASHKRWQAEPLWKSPPRAMVRSPGAPEATTGARASETFTSVSQRSQLWPNFVTTCTKTQCSRRFFSVARLKIRFNGKQLHPFAIPAFSSPPVFSFGNMLSGFSIVPLWRHRGLLLS